MEVEEIDEGVRWTDFTASLGGGCLPKDDIKRTSFDHTLQFELGDPHTTSGGQSQRYETSDSPGGPHCKYCLDTFCSTANTLPTMTLCTSWSTLGRDLTKVDPGDKTLAHWPAVAAWWASRLQYIGPSDEQVDLVLFEHITLALIWCIQHGQGHLD